MGSGKVTLPGTAGNYLSASSIVAYGYGTSFRMEGRAALVDWTRAADEQALFAQWTAGNLKFLVRVSQTGYLTFIGNGGALNVPASDPLGFTDGVAGWWAIDGVVGAGSGSLTFHKSSDQVNSPEAVSWTQISNHTGLTLPAVTAAGAVEIGSQATGTQDVSAGDFYRTRYTADSVNVFDPDMSSLTQAEINAAAFVEDSANAATVTINGAGWSAVPGASPSMMLLGIG